MSKAANKIQLLLVDDHEVIRSGIRGFLAEEQDLEIIGEASSGVEALDFVANNAVDVILMDISLGAMSGIEATQRILATKPKARIVALTMHDDEEYFFKMLEAGASGYITKQAAPEEIIAAIRAAHSGEIYLYPPLAKLLVRDHLREQDPQKREQMLTEREQEVLTFLAEGQSNHEIGEALHISPKTVGRHRENIMRKLELHNRTELVRYAIRKGIVQA